MLQDSLYHSILRVAALSFALILLFESGLVSPVTKELSDNARHYVASAIGVAAVVDPNELNTITAALTEQRHALDTREAALREREISVGLNGQNAATNNAVSTWILSAILFILLVLIILNYVLDYLRRQQTINGSESQPA